ncbi:MAG: hypothetical protein L0Y72_02765 [Gemmataceae bacterium]|nr:hypothetical protein [Gemmataceae bacterium]MCI0737939.1 hypothetical protein [Gemmataceae bacterium]
MRASSLSNGKVIELLNRYFIPVYLSNEDFTKEGSAPPEERKERQRIYRETLDAKRSAGSVHVYLVTPGGNAFDSMHVAEAYKVEKLVPMLEAAVKQHNPTMGRSLFPATAQSRHPKTASAALVLHLVARNLVKVDGARVPVRTKLGETRSANWGSYPSEDWIVFSKEETKKLLPSERVEKGLTWELDADLTGRLLVHFYPTTENNDVSKNKIQKQQLKAAVISFENGVARAKLTGHLTMEHWFYHKADGNTVDTRLVGYLDFEPASLRVRTLRLITEDATYNRRPFGVAVSSVESP